MKPELRTGLCQSATSLDAESGSPSVRTRSDGCESLLGVINQPDGDLSVSDETIALPSLPSVRISSRIAVATLMSVRPNGARLASSTAGRRAVRGERNHPRER
jgi:hypothetical protein